MTTIDTNQIQRQVTAAVTVIGMLNRRADSLITQGDDAIKKFTADLQGDHPTHAMQWAHGVMNATAARDVALYLKNCLKAIPNETNIWALREAVNDRVIGSAKFPSFSTSPTSNLMEQYKIAAFAEWASQLNSAVQHLEANGLTQPKSTTDEA